MYKLLGGLKDYFKAQDIQTDNAVFRLHNIFTTVLLLTCSLIITATQYVGQPISCIVNGYVSLPPFFQGLLFIAIPTLLFHLQQAAARWTINSEDERRQRLANGLPPQSKIYSV